MMQIYLQLAIVKVIIEAATKTLLKTKIACSVV